MAYGTLQTDVINSSTGVLATQNGMTGIAKAWVQFAGASGTIAGSFNVSSVTRVAQGVFTINFTTAQANANYAYNVNASPSAGYAANPGVASCNANGQTSTLVSPTTSAFTFTIYNLGASNFLDALQTNVIVCGS
jgi:hypothetical protein